MTMKEKRQLVMKYRRETAIILRNLLERCPFSQNVVSINPGDPFFDDSCNFVHLVSELRAFVDLLEKSNEYTQILSDYDE